LNSFSSWFCDEIRITAFWGCEKVEKGAGVEGLRADSVGEKCSVSGLLPAF
jgi:hypothetical protein